MFKTFCHDIHDMTTGMTGCVVTGLFCHCHVTEVVVIGLFCHCHMTGAVVMVFSSSFLMTACCHGFCHGYGVIVCYPLVMVLSWLLFIVSKPVSLGLVVSLILCLSIFSTRSWCVCFYFPCSVFVRLFGLFCLLGLFYDALLFCLFFSQSEY